MSLQRKFVALLTVLALAVFVNLGAALWMLSFLQREFVRPLGDMKLMLPRLGEVKRCITQQASILGGGPEGFPFREGPVPTHPEESRPRFDAIADQVAAHLRFLESQDQYQSLVGISTTRNLHDRIGEGREAARRWFESGSDTERAGAIALFVRAHDLIERMEANVTESAASLSYTEYAPRIRTLLLVDLLASIAIVFLAFTLGVILIRRWVVHPVGLLRDAADRLARGEFSHRVPVTTRDELGLLSSEVNHMAGMISAMQEERIDRERLAAAGEVVRRLAHNLRNPLAGIRSLAELSRTDLPPESPTRDNQTRIVQTVDRFERWLAEMLSATTPLTLRLEQVDVPTWMTNLVEPLRASATARGVRLDVDAREAPRTATFDPRHLEQAVVGIITNAIQASPTGQAVSIAANSCPNDDAWELSITDRGPGVPPELLDKIFRPYFTTKRDGTGIGLAVAKQVAEQHAGRIRVEPASGTANGDGSGLGARFVLKLPLAGRSDVANTGQSGPGVGARIGQDSDHRG